MSDSKRAKMTPLLRDEAARLKAIWDSRPHRTQTEFGEHYGLGNQSNVGHYLNGRSPLNLKAALAFASELRCQLREFSPRLHQETLATLNYDADLVGFQGADGTPGFLAQVKEPAATFRDREVLGWPFEGITQARWNRLTERQKGRIEKVVKDELEAIESETKLKTRTGS